jgi:hypothetical protein
MKGSLQKPLLAVLLAVLIAPAAPAAAQSLTLKTVPIPTGDQFFLLPSRGAGMGGIYAAVRDTLGDPWGNPATGARLQGVTLFAAPGGYAISNDMGAGIALSAGSQFRAGDWFGGGAAAIQQIDNPNQNWFGWEFPERDRFIQEALDNDYVQLYVGRRINERTAVGASVYHAGLRGVESIGQLYAGSAQIDQDGGLTDYRVGLVHDFRSGATLEAVLLHSRLNMTHDVGYVTWTQTEQVGQFGNWEPSVRIEQNLDRTRTSGVHLGLELPLPQEGETLGFGLTANRKTHPKIPNYEIANIPRDPGNSTVFAMTAGYARRTGPSTVGFELTFSPARTHTWGEAEERITVPGGGTIPIGGKTVENWFRFSNARAAAGFERDAGNVFAYRLGFGMNWYRYRLTQTRHVQATTSKTRESWFEWSPTWGLTLRPEGFSIHYTGRLTAKGFPDLFTVTEDLAVNVPGDGGIDFLPAVSQPVQLDDFATWSHQLSVMIAVGRKR